ncbi:cupredoxin family copper-binding protein [Azospirillum sp. TSO22-1]|uniref:cupredoxin domain-containing protein n=1 Tax=Azospirillum sp. TSO22-1 TaxID=716789 RepID=UPI000D603A7D|nr:cupredoxin family copper-binding protein [Azospirillum sp. TSO22-1]PWC40351.1 amicyanin [Azospirillum sp. TSO22-1]
MARYRHLPGAALAAALATPLTAAAALAAEPAEVRIDNFTFNPPSLTVAPGTVVTFSNADDIPHTVAASDRSWKSPVLDTGQSFSFTFAKPGSYAYFCSLHPRMVGVVVVAGP